MSIGERIAYIRKEQGMTQAKLAKLSKLSTSAIAMYETNRRVPDDTVLHTIAQTLGVPVQDFQKEPTVDDKVDEKVPLNEPSNEPSTESAVATLSLSREEARLLLYLRMNPKQMGFLQTYIMANQRKRTQLEKAWKLIQEFQA